MSAGPHSDRTTILTSLKDYLEKIRLAEIQRARRKLGALSPNQEMAIASLTSGIVNSIIDQSMNALGESNWGSEETALTIRLFNLQL
jgi:glutamyl-tRNA reductase